ncbi:hypothetical protein QUF58_08145 [Anaerolineales bacterium HSG24]|nr:hypothetical protein [Anaerolineales bacterium HSG24]
MTFSFPDIIGEYILAPKRHSTGGVQYAGYFEPATIKLGQVANLFIFLQNNLNVPNKVTVNFELPKTGGLFGGGSPALEVEETSFEQTLQRGEAGLLTLPVIATQQAKSKDYSLGLQLDVKPQGAPSERIRPDKSSSLINTDLIDNPVGLNLVGALGATYVEKQVKKAGFTINVDSKETVTDETPLEYSYQTVFSDKDAEFFNRASQEIELRRVKLDKEITPDGLYTALFSTSTVKFADAGVPLRVGEAITLAKILTYSCQYFLDNPKNYNGLLLPMWQRAFEVEYDTTDALDVICKVGYYHLMKLSIAISFNLVARAAGKQIWSLDERQGVTGFIADNIETGQQLDLDFLYLPLLIAGAYISKKIVMPKEDSKHSLRLLQVASQNRETLFADPEMAEPRQIFTNIIKRSLK